MALKTTEGRARALEALAERRQDNRGAHCRAETERLPAGSPMYFGCIACNGCIQVPEDYLTRPKLCRECDALRECGWLE